MGDLLPLPQKRKWVQGMDIKKFEVGKTYDCEALYGGLEVIRVVERTDSTVSFIYTDDDEREVRTKPIIMQNTYDDDETGSICGKGEAIIAWDYIPCGGRYGNDKFYGYFMA